MTPILDTPPAINAILEDLLLVRMALPSKKPAPASLVRKDIGKLLGSELTTAQFDALRGELVSAGYLMQGKRNVVTVTEKGRERVQRFLGVTDLPPRLSWSLIISRYLFPKAAELSPGAAAKLDSWGKLAAFLLKRKYGLSAGAGSTVNEVLQAIVCKELGFQDETTLDGLACSVLSRLRGTERLTKEQLVKQLPLFDTGLVSASADAVRRKMVRDWLSGASPGPQSSEPERRVPFDLAEFAATVQALALTSPPQDRFHDNKVFIAALWRASQREPSFPRLTLTEFKQRLVEANGQSMLHLSRADLVQAMDPQLVADSETAYLNATFHFVLLERNRP